ncbi:hypothetical protein CPB86DRAFT_408881 [Serendipita vermifera]|nr:hypothetical protein CPB86DRAFT_408881 [Serendipita vermifera]
MSHFEGQIPGGVLKIIVEEHRFVDELVQLLRRRVDLDEKYNRDLAALCEVTIRRATCKSIKDILDEIPVINPPDKLEEGGSMLDGYQKLIEVNERLEENKEAANSQDSVLALQEWLSRGAPKSKYGDQDLFTTTREFDSVQVAEFRLPEAGSTGKVSTYSSR